MDAVIAVDHILGGAVDYANAEPPEEPEDLPIGGAQSFSGPPDRYELSLTFNER